MRNSFLLEFKRIFHRKHILIFCLLFLISLYFVFVGLKQYQLFEDFSEDFKSYENLKISQYINYEQYGGFGFRILAKHPALSVFFGSFDFYNLRSNIDVKEVIDIESSFKGQYFIKTIINNHDFSGVIFLFGTLIMIYFGVEIFRSLNSFRLRKRFRFVFYCIFSRAVILTVMFGIVFFVSFLFAFLLGAQFQSNDILIFSRFTGYSLILLNLFYLAGLLISLVYSFKKRAFWFSIFVWFICIFILPEGQKIGLKNSSDPVRNEVVNSEKLKGLFEFERKVKENAANIRASKNPTETLKKYIIDSYVRVYESNKVKENELKKSVTHVIGRYTRNSAFFPTSYYYVLSREVAARGFSQYNDFLDHVIDLRDRFFKFYVDKRYSNENQKPIKYFIEVDKQVYPLESKLPGSFIQALIFLSIYTLILLAFVLILIPVRLKEKEISSEKISIPALEVGEINFRCITDEMEREVFKQSLARQGVSVVKEINRRDLENVRIRDFAKYLSFLEGKVPFQKTLRLLIELECRIEAYTADIDEEDIKKVFLAVALAKDKDIYLFENFLKGVSREFENKFFSLLSDKKYIYLSGEMYHFEEEEISSSLVSLNPKDGASFR